MSLEEVQLLKDGSGVAVPPRGEFAEWPNMEKENETADEKDKGTANGGSTTVSGDGKVIRQMVVPTPRTLTSVEIAWGKARGYKWAADAEAAQKQTAHEPDAQSPSDSTPASQAGYGDWSGDPYYGSHYGYGDWSGDPYYGSHYGYGDWSGDPYYGSHADGYYSYGDWSGDASQCGGGNGDYGYGDWSGDASQSGGGNGYYGYGDGSWDASQSGGGNGYYGYGDGSWDVSQSGAEHELQKDSTAEKTERTKEEVKNAKKEEADPEAEKTEETKEEVKNAKKEEEEVNPEAEKTENEKIKDVENAKKEEEEVNPEAEKTEKIKDVENAKKEEEEEVNPEAEKTEKIKDVENDKEEEVNPEAEKTERIKDVENAKKEVEVARQENEDFLEKRFYFGIGDFEGVILPEKLDDLALLLKDRNYVTSEDVWYFYYNAIKDEEYLEILVDEAQKHPCLAGFEASVRESHGLLEWSFGCDGESTYVEDLAEMTHYLQIQHEAEVAQKFNKENQFNTEDFDKVAKGLDFGFGEFDGDGVKKENEKNHRKEKGTTQKLKDIKTEKVTAPLTRVRTKGQPKRKSLSEDEEAWVVKWAPVTKTGILDFAQNCLGHPVSSAEKPPLFANTSVENLDYMNTSSISWQPIKPGETTYLLNHFFRQVNPKDMALEQFIQYCKDIDWNCVNPFPDGTPKAVRSTMVAVNEMWEEYRTENPDEVQWWLTEW